MKLNEEPDTRWLEGYEFPRSFQDYLDELEAQSRANASVLLKALRRAPKLSEDGRYFVFPVRFAKGEPRPPGCFP